MTSSCYDVTLIDDLETNANDIYKYLEMHIVLIKTAILILGPVLVSMFIYNYHTRKIAISGVNSWILL